MVLQILHEAGVTSEIDEAPTQPLFELHLAGSPETIRSNTALELIQRATAATEPINRQRSTLAGSLRQYAELDFGDSLTETAVLPTATADQSAAIITTARCLVKDLGLNLVIELPPTVLGHETICHLLHDRCGLRRFTPLRSQFATTIGLEQAAALSAQLQECAQDCGRTVALRIAGSVAVEQLERPAASPQHRFLANQPLFALALDAAWQLRKAVGEGVSISLASGVDATNFPTAVGCGLAPVGPAADLLYAGGYGRLHRYLLGLEHRMQAVDASDIESFILDTENHRQRALDLVRQGTEPLEATDRTEPEPDSQSYSAADEEPEDDDAPPCSERFSPLMLGLERWPAAQRRVAVQFAATLNLHALVERVLDGPLASPDEQSLPPRKIGSQLALFDYLNCDKCVPICPHDANFVFEVPLASALSQKAVITDDGTVQLQPDKAFRLESSRQIANYAPFCDDCMLCDLFCPEDGGPQTEKPRVFGSREAFQHEASANGWYLERRPDGQLLVWTRLSGRDYQFQLDNQAATARLSDGILELQLDVRSGAIVHTAVLEPTGNNVGHSLSAHEARTILTIVNGLLDPARPNPVNAQLLGDDLLE